METGDKNIQGYKGAVDCQKYKPDTKRCPSQAVTTSVMEEEFADMPNQADVNKAVNAMKSLINKMGDMGDK
jgi:hypothetical protein